MNIEAILSNIPLYTRLDEHLREVIHGASVALMLKVLGAIFHFGFNVLLARLLGAEGTGIYFLALTMTTIATVIGRMGLDNALLRFTAANAAIGKWEAVKGVYQKGMIIAFIASSIIASIMALAAPWLANSIFSKPDLTGPMRLMTLAVIPVVYLMLHAEMLKGLKLIRDSLIVQGVGVPALSFLGLYIFVKFWGLNGAILAYIFSTMIMAIIGFCLWRKAAPQLHNTIGYFKTSDLLQSSMSLFWVAFINLLINWTATFLLGIWGTKVDVGIFGVAYRTAMLTSFILIAVNSIAAPKFAYLYEKRDMKALSSTARNSAKLMTLIASPLLLMFIVASNWIMKIFGPQFSEGATILVILAIGQFVNVLTGSVSCLLIMSGHEHLMRNNVFFVAIMNIMLNFILVPLAGALGAAIATAICISSINLIATYFVWSRLKIWIIPFVYKGVKNKL